MTTIRFIESRDVNALSAAFPEKDPDQFDQYYLEHLLKKRVVFVAYQADELAGYVMLMWESGYDNFWRRRIPEIVDLNVVADYRRQGIGTALIQACERHAKESNYSMIGISVVQDDADYDAARRLYPKLGYEPDGHGVTPHDNELHLIKSLK